MARRVAAAAVRFTPPPMSKSRARQRRDSFGALASPSPATPAAAGGLSSRGTVAAPRQRQGRLPLRCGATSATPHPATRQRRNGGLAPRGVPLAPMAGGEALVSDRDG